MSNEQIKNELPSLYTPGVSGLKQWGGIVREEFHPKLQGKQALKAYREMADNDPIVGYILYMWASLLKQCDTNIAPQNEGDPFEQMIADYVKTCFDDMSISWSDLMNEILTMNWAGFSLLGMHYKIRRGSNNLLKEMRSKHDDGGVGWRKFQPRCQDTIDRWVFDSEGDAVGAIQLDPNNYKRIELPFESHLLFRPAGSKNNPEGRSLLRNAYRTWWYLKRLQEIEAVGLEKDLTGVLVFKMPVEYFSDDASTAQKTTVERFRKLTERARRGEQDGLCVPTSEDSAGKTGFDLSLMQGGGRRPMDSNEIIKRLESRIAISVLAEGAMLGMQGDAGSSRALHSSKTALSAMAMRSMQTSIEDVFNRFAIPRLVAACGWPVEASPTLTFGDIESDDSGELANSIGTLITAGVLTPGPELEKYMRIRMGLPLDENISDGQMQDALGAMQEQDNQPLQQEEKAEEPELPPAASMSVDEAAELAGVSTSRIKAAIRRGQIPGAKIGNTFRIMREDLNGYMKQGSRWQQQTLF